MTGGCPGRRAPEAVAGPEIEPGAAAGALGVRGGGNGVGGRAKCLCRAPSCGFTTGTTLEGRREGRKQDRGGNAAPRETLRPPAVGNGRMGGRAPSFLPASKAITTVSMSKRKVSFEVGSGDQDESLLQQVGANGSSAGGPGSRFKGKHSLDSDEEDEADEGEMTKYDILATEDIEGEGRRVRVK
ncbi:CD2 antigen cytoplasmic tail-binding protein 2, partial [Carcharodon carcharias]|uniref:CD2 antigen cytoplasmic tail-binding protein 2 n=1 Tax=Carcharodon carcharias TaxID=13397 RepID=UPI001B7E3431